MTHPTTLAERARLVWHFSTEMADDPNCNEARLAEAILYIEKRYPEFLAGVEANLERDRAQRAGDG